MKTLSTLILLALTIAIASTAAAQGLWMHDGAEPESWTKPYEAPRHVWKKHDMVMIRIDLDSRAIRELDTDISRELDIDSSLDDYLRFASFPQVVPGDGIPRRVAASSGIDSKNESSAERRSRFSDVIMAKVVEVMPNYDPDMRRGNLRIMASRSVKMSDDDETTTLTGEIPVSQILPDESIPLSRVADLRLVQESEGVLGTGARPGWFTNILLNIWPF